MSENNFLPYEIKKRRRTIKNSIISSMIFILTFINIIFCIKVYLSICNYNNSISNKNLMDYTRYTSSNVKNIERNFKNINAFNSISQKIKNENWSSIEIKSGTVNFSLDGNINLKNVTKNLEEKFKIQNISKSENSNLYNFVVEGEENER